MNMGGDGQLSYADHDVHHIRHRAKVIGTDADDADHTDVRNFEITQRGLAPDELAELKVFRVSVGLTFDAETAEDSVGGIDVGLGAGFNLADGEFLQTADFTQELIDSAGDGTDDINIRYADTDEVGELWNYRTALSAPFDDDANGNGGGAYGVNLTETLHMDQLFGSGPYVDSADDFSSLIEVNENNNTASVGVEVAYSLYYDVMETEGGRTRFGR